MPIPIMNRPTTQYVTLYKNAVRLSARPWFLRALVALWDAGVQTGVDPAVLAGQCAHETGYGRFGRAVDATFGNTCGLKKRDASGEKPEDHARFPIATGGFPLVGAVAHAHHLRLYAGFPVPDNTPDPRAVWIKPGTENFGSCLYVSDLSGKWAPSRDYGPLVEASIRALAE